jgi:ABC-type Zn uptake system ZnuABC Zn-binding protein ZnuA
VPLLGVLFVVGCPSAEDGWPTGSGKKRIMVSFAPLYCFATNVAGDDADVQCLLTDQGPHEYEVQSRDGLRLHRADLFLINGFELDNRFAKSLKNNAANPNLPIVDVADFVPKDQRRPPLAEDNDPKEKGKDEHEHHGQYDPHVWLGIPQAREMVNGIRNKLKEIDPAHAKGYDERADAYIAKLTKILDDGKERLAKKSEKRMLTFHDSLQYFGPSLGLDVVASLQERPDEAPSEQRLGKLLEICLEPTKRKPPEPAIRVIAVEPSQTSNTAAQAFKEELQRKGVKDAEIVEIDVLEEVAGNDLSPQLYEEKMRANIDRLVKALK